MTEKELAEQLTKDYRGKLKKPFFMSLATLILQSVEGGIWGHWGYISWKDGKYWGDNFANNTYE